MIWKKLWQVQTANFIEAIRDSWCVSSFPQPFWFFITVSGIKIKLRRRWSLFFTIQDHGSSVSRIHLKAQESVSRNPKKCYDFHLTKQPGNEATPASNLLFNLTFVCHPAFIIDFFSPSRNYMRLNQVWPRLLMIFQLASSRTSPILGLINPDRTRGLHSIWARYALLMFFFLFIENLSL